MRSAAGGYNTGQGHVGNMMSRIPGRHQPNYVQPPMMCGGRGFMNFQREDLSPLQDRNCTDILWQPTFLCVWAFGIFLAVWGTTEGDWNKLRYGINSQNQLCGVGEMSGREKLITCFAPTLDYNEADTNTTFYADYWFSVCGPECPNEENDLVEVYKLAQSEFTTRATDDFWTRDDYYWLKSLCIAPSRSLLNRCVFDYTFGYNATKMEMYFQEGEWGNPMEVIMGTTGQQIINMYNDMLVTWHLILAFGAGCGMLMAFIYLLLLKYFATFMVWFALVLFFAILGLIDTYFAIEAGYLYSSSESGYSEEMDNDWENFYYYAFWFTTTMIFIFVCVLIFLLNRIRLAIALVKESIKVMKIMPQMIFTPIPVLIVQTGTIYYMMLIGCYLASAGTISENELQWDTTLRWMIVAHLFICLWTILFWNTFHLTVMAGCVSEYYWTRDKEDIIRPVLRSTRRAGLYHVGTMICGSLLLAVVFVIKWYCLFCVFCAKRFERRNTPIITYLLNCLLCIVSCLTRCVQFLTRNAFIMTAVDGKGFCVSSAIAFNMILANSGRMTACNFVSQYLFFIGRLTVSGLCALGTYWVVFDYYLYQESGPTVTSWFMPTLMTFILAWIVSYIFFEVVDFTIDVLLLCFCLDDLKNADTGDYYASNNLLKFMATAPRMIVMHS